MRLVNLVRSRQVLGLSALGLLLANVGLGAVLAVFALRPHPFVVTPMVKDAQLAAPGEVPPDAVRRFVLHYLYYLDDYTAHTLKDRSNYVLRYISPTFAEKAAKDLTDRLRYVERAREATQLVTPPPALVQVIRTGEGSYRASLLAVKRIYIGDRLTQEGTLRYTVDVRSVLPSDADPYGFLVTGQGVEAVAAKEPSAPAARTPDRRTP
jgi:hypothetical protein